MGQGNPNPSPATRFKPGEPGLGRTKQKGDRDRVSGKFLQEMADHFEVNGKNAIERVFKDDPARYLAAVASIVPKEIEITRPLDGLDDGALAKAIEVLADALRMQAPLPEERPESPSLN